ncbi:TonB-dependent receptor plug domain-containing protein, partial [Sphingobacterium siyangense]|uniref:TonB-dependent receptor plug domain-containing protein n=1 Tax=Sphingobacterium siyangense TaxID=459529 RepID=UPI003C7704C0
MNYFYKGGRELPIGKKSSFTYGIRSMILEIARLKLYSLLLGVSMLHMFSLSAQTPRKDSGAGGQYFLKGTVVSAIDDKALQGVSVRLEAEDKRVSTNKDGSFELMVTQPTGKVKFTFIGYNTVESSYSVAVPMRIYLVPKDNQLDEVEVVSTGYQKIPKERATGSFEFVDNKLLNRKVSTDFVSRLQDVVPGISIFDKGQRETKGFLMRMNVRGQSSLTAASPLIVVDGVPYESKLADYGLGEFNNINPNDIESISVLKDASAASIWGAQSGNGVIVITTKKGKFNARPKIAFNSNISIKNKPDLFYYPQMTAKDYIDLTQILFDKGRYDSYFNDLYYNPLDIVWS